MTQHSTAQGSAVSGSPVGGAVTDEAVRGGAVRTLGRAALAVVGGSIVASLLDAVVAAIWHAAGASQAFHPLHPSAFVGLTVVGILFGTIGWCIVRARAADPARTMRVLVPVVLILSFIPDVLVGAKASMAGTTWGAVSGLMVMHVLVAAVALTAFGLLLPLPARRR
jgi:hypothetical protein